MSTEIRAVFPKFIYKKDEVCVNHIPSFRDRVYEIQQSSGTRTDYLMNVKSTHLTNMKLHEDPVFKPLVDQIYDSTIEYATHIGYSPGYAFKLAIGNMWTNISGKGDYNFPHIHAGSIISGAYYISTVPENKIVFFDNYHNMEVPTNVDYDTYDRMTYECFPGRLLLFRGDMPHGNPPQMNDGEKIVISFNIASLNLALEQ